jgi:hypothetical protein
MTKRQMPDLSKLLADTAVPMSDATEPPQFGPRLITKDSPAPASEGIAPTKPRQAPHVAAQEETATANLENLNFKVPKSFRKRFRDCAYKADLKHNELLFAALDAWEEKQNSKN